jgi:hypothetical protein
VTPAELTAQYFPPWRVWQSSSGHWYAARAIKDVLSTNSGETVDADTDEGMAALLAARRTS